MLQEKIQSPGLYPTILTILFATALFMIPTQKIMAQAVIGQDHASNYGDTWAGNGGGGFGDWNLYRTDGNESDAGHFLGSSIVNGHGNINFPDGRSFGMYGNNNAFSNAQRTITTWGDGYSFSIQLATRLRDGSRGITLFNTNGFAEGDEIWNFNITNSGYDPTDWDFCGDIIITITALQNGNNLSITVTATGTGCSFSDDYTTTISNETLGGFRLYTGGHNQGNQGERDLYFNSLTITTNNQEATLSGNITVGSILIPSGDTLNAGGNTIIIQADGFFENNGTFNAGTGSVVFQGESEVRGTSDTHFYDVVLESGDGNGVNFGVGEGISTINNFFYIKNGFVRNNAPILGDNSTLFYQATPHDEPSNYNRQIEWNNPANVHVGFNTNLNMNIADFGDNIFMSGNLIIDENSSVSIDDEHAYNFIVEGNVTVNGELFLQNIGGGGEFSDLFIGGDLAVADPSKLVTNNREVVFNGTTDQEITNLDATNPVVTFAYLRIDKNSGRIITNSDITITEELRLDNGLLDTGSNQVLITNDATVTSGSNNSYIVGTLKREVSATESDYHFPLGSLEGFHPVVINFAAISQVAEQQPAVTARFIPDLPDNYYGNLPYLTPEPDNLNITSLNEYGYWQINQENINSTTYSLTLTSTLQADLPVDAAVRILRRNDGGYEWEMPGSFSDLNTDNGITVTHTGLTGFSEFTLGGDNNTPLPVELLDFRALPSPDGILLNWSTATETNNDYFTLLHSINGIDFVPLAFIEGAGNSNILLHYQYLDTTPQPGLNYYQLKQTDFDGTFALSPVVALDHQPNRQEATILYRHGEIIVALPWESTKRTEAILTDLAGRLIWKTSLDHIPGQTITLTPGINQSGMYILILNHATEPVIQKIVIP